MKLKKIFVVESTTTLVDHPSGSSVITAPLFSVFKKHINKCMELQDYNIELWTVKYTKYSDEIEDMVGSRFMMNQTLC